MGILRKTTKDSSQSSRRGLGRLYRVPVPHQLWGQPQPENETNWAELFSDLTYVGVAFQEGALLADSLKSKNFAEGFAIFLVTFVLFYDVWRVRLQLSARFHARDIAHKLLDIIQMLFVAAAALHIGTLDKFKDLSTFYTLGFAVAMTGLSILATIRGLELLIWSPLLASRGMGEQMVRRELIPLALKLFSVYASVPSSGFEWYVPVAVWGSILVQVRLDMFMRIYYGDKIHSWYTGRIGREYSVPMNIEYSIHRYGEWTMLMLGEGILQLIVVPVTPSDEFYTTFVLGYILMALLQLLHYSTEPNHPDGHCMRRSGRRVFFWVTFESLYSASLVCVGVGLKLVLKYSTDEDLGKTQQYRSLLACACAAAIMLVWACRLCHAGFSEEFLLPTGHMRFKKLMIWVVKIALAGVCLALAFVEVNNWVVEAGCAVCVLLSFSVQVFDSRRFGDSLRKRARPHRTVSDIEKEGNTGDDTGSFATSSYAGPSADDEALTALDVEINVGADDDEGEENDVVNDNDEEEEANVADEALAALAGETLVNADDGDKEDVIKDEKKGRIVDKVSSPVHNKKKSPKRRMRKSKFDIESGKGNEDDGYVGLERERLRCELLRQDAWSTRDVMVCDGMGLPEHSSWVEVDLKLVDSQIEEYETQIKELKRLRRRHGARVDN